MKSIIRTYDIYHEDTCKLWIGHMLLINWFFCPWSTDKSYFMLVRWFEAHPDAWERDDMCRPLCPGPLRHNHCLWRYAVTQRPRRIMTSQDGTPSPIFTSQSYMFGADTRTRNLRWSEEQHEYYGLVSPSSVLSTVSMSREYHSNNMSHVDSWLETVTISW